MAELPSVPVFERPDRRQFEHEIQPLNRPVLLKGVAAHWPCVEAAKAGPQALGAWLKAHDTGAPVQVSITPADQKGLFYHRADFGGFNFVNQSRTLSQVVYRLLGHGGSESLYVQGVPVDDHLPGAGGDLTLPLLDEAVRPRIWIGNDVVTQTHFDLSANIACHVAGEKTFTLFPPDQTANLYPGPTDVTPAGVPVSQVLLDAPDFGKFPRFAEALGAAQQARLAPGDGLYIPPLWWHHVRTAGPLNMLVNYWWQAGRDDLASPLAALYLAGLAFRHLPPQQRDMWRQMMDCLVFVRSGDPMEHMADVPSLFQGDVTSEQMAAFQAYFRDTFKV